MPTSPSAKVSRRIAVVLCVLAKVVSARGDVVHLPCIADTTLYQGFEHSNGAGSYLFAGNTNRFGARRVLLRFDPAASIPTGSTITSARLTLTMDQTINGEFSFSIHRVLGAWNEGAVNSGVPGGVGDQAQNGDVTWDARSFNFNPSLLIPWNTPGGDFVAAPSAMIQIGGQGQYTWGSTSQMTADVQAWFQTPSTNSGWIIVGQNVLGATAKRFVSRNNANAGARPVLEVVYTPPGPVCNDIDFNNDGSFFDPQDIDAFLSVYGEGPCIPASATCDSIDFNNDTSVFDPCDIDSFLTVFGEGPCTVCGQ
ncbi:MAG: DNRLRE domain-containing protein [Phycisphaerales bacterium]